MLSVLKVKLFQPNFAIFSRIFFTNSENASKSKIKAGSTEYFKQVKIHGITFGVLWIKSQFQSDFTDNFLTRVSMDEIWTLALLGL